MFNTSQIMGCFALLVGSNKPVCSLIVMRMILAGDDPSNISIIIAPRILIVNN